MPQIAYMVTATIPDASLVEQYVHWLTHGHVADVVKGGAESGEVVRLESDTPGGPPRVMSRYVFASREAFDHYIRVVAPVLRAEGLAKFGPDKGVIFTRLVGEITPVDAI